MDVAVLERRSRRADNLVRRGRSMLVDAVREADAQGMSQRQIAAAIGRSQPEVNRLLRFHGSSPAGLALRKARPAVMKVLADAGLKNVRVFGSTARGEDTADSDIDLLVTRTRPLGLLALVRVEKELSDLVGYQVDLVLDDAIRPDLADEITSSAVKL